LLRIHNSAWLLVLLSAVLQILIFPLPDLYFLDWAAVTPLLIALLRAREPDTLQLLAGVKLLPAKPGQAFLLAYACGILWYAGTCYWIYNTMRQYGGVGTLAACGLLILFCLYLAIYHGVFGLLISMLASPAEGDGTPPSTRRALLLAPFAWVAVELARTRITGFPWDLLGISQVDNIPLAHIATVTGVYGLSFEIMVVNTALAAAFVIGAERGQRSKRKPLLLATAAAGGAYGLLFVGGLQVIVAAAPERNRGGILSALYLLSYLSMGALALVLGAIATTRGLGLAVDLGAAAIILMNVATLVLARNTPST